MNLGPNFQTTLLAARTGAEWAWTALYREYAPALLRYLRARGASDPENTLGEVFVRVVKKLPQFEGNESEFKAWLFTIARNQLIDEVRRRERRPAQNPIAPEKASTCAGREGQTESGVQSSYARVKEILEHLTPEQRDVLFLRVLAGLTIEETAEVLGKSSGSVKRLQSRGLRSLRKKNADGVVSL